MWKKTKRDSYICAMHGVCCADMAVLAYIPKYIDTMVALFRLGGAASHKLPSLRGVQTRLWLSARLGVRTLRPLQQDLCKVADTPKTS
jgi:hypothetical protein